MVVFVWKCVRVCLLLNAHQQVAAVSCGLLGIGGMLGILCVCMFLSVCLSVATGCVSGGLSLKDELLKLEHLCTFTQVLKCFWYLP